MFHTSTPLPTRMTAHSHHGHIKQALVAGGICALALATASAWAQTTPAPAMGTASTSATTSPPADASKLASADGRMLGNLAQANRAEVEAGKLALEKSQNPDIKKFAQSMVDAHGKALGEVEQLGAAKNVKLPDGVGVMHKAKETAMKALSGKTFDSQYVKRMGVGDHESAVKLLQDIQKNGKDADLKALADKMLPDVQHHLEMAKQMEMQITAAK